MTQLNKAKKIFYAMVASVYIIIYVLFYSVYIYQLIFFITYLRKIFVVLRIQFVHSKMIYYNLSLVKNS